MRYREIIDFYANETTSERLARLNLMYGLDETEERAEQAEIELLAAKAAKLRADALAAVLRAKAENEDLDLGKGQASPGYQKP